MLVQEEAYEISSNDDQLVRKLRIDRLLVDGDEQ